MIPNLVSLKIACTPVVFAAGALVFGLLTPLGSRSALADPAPIKYDMPTQLAKISMPSKPYALAWSANGAYLAGGTSFSDPSEIFVVEVAKASIIATLNVSGWVQAMAFSPDGKWLTVGTSLPEFKGPAPGELAIFDVPAFTKKFTAKTSGTEKSFSDLAWAPDGRALYAIDHELPIVEDGKIRRWVMPAFTEQPAIKIPRSGTYYPLAVSPDGATLAIINGSIRLFDIATGKERNSYKVARTYQRLGFSADGKAIAVFDTSMSWFDTASGKPAKPNPARVAIQPVGLSGDLSRFAISPDGRKHVQATAEYPKFIFQGMGEPKNKYGAFVRVTDNATGKTLTWRVGQANGMGDQPVVAFAPDGTKLAGTARLPGGESLLIWAVPK
jgi:WD40 repeat protein